MKYREIKYFKKNDRKHRSHHLKSKRKEKKRKKNKSNLLTHDEIQYQNKKKSQKKLNE